MHLLFGQRGTGCENDNGVGLKLAIDTCVAPGAVLVCLIRVGAKLLTEDQMKVHKSHAFSTLLHLSNPTLHLNLINIHINDGDTISDDILIMFII